MDRDLNLNRAETFSYINPWILYFLFIFSFTFWVFSLCIVAIGVYAKVQKAADAFLIDPAIILIVVGVVMFFITYCGCNRTLHENNHLLKTFSFSLTLVFIVQLIIAILCFFTLTNTGCSGQACEENHCSIVHYHDDLDIQNLCMCCGWNNYTDWSWNIYFNCSQRNPSNETCTVPFSCCTPVSRENVIKTMCGFGVQTQTLAASIYTEGCSDSAVMWTESHLLLVGTLALGLALPQIAGIVLSQMLVSQINSEINSLL
ncbi:hypothetical protein Q7C36_009644 [Tachysurus vachellii]|uniref:Tetraspanin n=1 Tax=Tachysurus vachellii TaxID=175792 RepID=A0AA88N0Q4_TACVA|nr:hypothetical protein Q7C36_009644 [Tachysurus vachellii]